FSHLAASRQMRRQLGGKPPYGRFSAKLKAAFPAGKAAPFCYCYYAAESKKIFLIHDAINTP
ncbi:MAG: hypothetical protein NC228_05200, partial [[Eubacterium] siraeum]|nr:hypothetical protein [[Eubacterium] siraeum]